MSARIIDGKGIAREIRAGLAEQVAIMAKRGGERPGLAVILVGGMIPPRPFMSVKRQGL